MMRRKNHCSVRQGCPIPERESHVREKHASQQQVQGRYYTTIIARDCQIDGRVSDSTSAHSELMTVHGFISLRVGSRSKVQLNHSLLR